MDTREVHPAFFNLGNNVGATTSVLEPLTGIERTGGLGVSFAFNFPEHPLHRHPCLASQDHQGTGAAYGNNKGSP